MKNNNETTIATATAAISAAALAAVETIVAAKAGLAIVIREQSTILRKAGVSDKEIARIVREAVAGAASPSHISRILTGAGIRLRGKRSDAGALRLADGALALCTEPKPDKPGEGNEGDGEGEGDEGEGEGEGDDNEGGGHTAETLASLLASLDPDLVHRALEIAGLA
jgi:hypothetical protein